VDLLPIYRSAVRQFDSRVRAVGEKQWAAKTPDAEWDVRDLVDHVVAGQRAVAGVFTTHLAASVDEEVATVGAGGTDGVDAASASGVRHSDGSDPLADDPVGAWSAASTAAVEALSRPGALDGDLPGEAAGGALEYGWRAATELTVHAWDLARATNGVDEFPNDLIGEVLAHAKASYDQWYTDNKYAPSIPVPGCTDDLIELLALTGRNRWWRPA